MEKERKETRVPDQPAASPEALWQVLVSEPMTGVTIVSIDGQILYANEQAAKIFFGPDARACDYIGKMIQDLQPAEWYTQRLKIFHQVAQTGTPVMLRSIWLGQQQFSWVYPIEPEDSEEVAEDWGAASMPQRFLVTTRRVADEPIHLTDEPVEMIESDVVDLGPLSQLTPRELEVLALIGQGLSAKEIAKMLHRSTKTIDNHRQSIGKKLNLGDRLALAEVARKAGLKLADAEKPRV